MFFKPEYILILLFTIIIDYYAGIYLEKIHALKERKKFLIASLVANIGVLAVFKYYNFINSNITGIANLLGYSNPVPFFIILLPIGLSFHTFQAMSYTIEVYRGNQKAEKHFGIYALYVMFYPQLVAGPIERPQNILHQFHERKYFNYENAVEGTRLILYGLFKKIVIADRLAIYVNQFYADVNSYSSFTALLAVVFFSFQIYCDFSGYSDIARGTAKFMGYDLMINFNRPYLSQSIGEFWKRWHISLSSWFRDYLYIPLGGNRVSKMKVYRNYMIVFLISGLWHGASWNFVIWGGLHGLFLILAIVSKPLLNDFENLGRSDFSRNLIRVFNTLWVFVLVSFAWVFFRAESFDKAMLVFHKIGELNFSMNMTQLCAQKGPLNLALSILVLIMLFISYKIPEKLKHLSLVTYSSVLIFLILVLGENGAAEFIYFQF
jgi:D-alanyl-lipoteichoic acid acyltransferase DltB (MBOAT superfamily)